MIAKAVQREGPRAPLFCLGIAMLMPALAFGQQTVERSELERCAALESAAEKLACFEALTAPPVAVEEEAAEPEVVAQPAPEIDPVVESLSPPLTDEVLPAATAVAAEPLPQAEAAAAAAPAAASTTATDSVPEAGPEFGREQLEPRIPEDRPDTVTATVAEVWKGGNRMLYFQFTNGQIWRQMESDYFYYPKDREFDITIRQGMMGEYQMRLDGRARMTRIIRVK